jgi:restriction endonuclease Mrr
MKWSMWQPDDVELAGLMIDHGVGVSTVRTFDLKRLDMDLFQE